MSKTTKTILGLVILIIIVLAIYLGIGKKATQVEEKPVAKETVRATIKIGAILPLTGGGAMMGDSGRKALLLAKEKLSGTKYNYELIFEDDRLDPGMTASAINKLVGIDKVDAVISFSSGSGNVISPITQQNGVIHCGIASDPNVAKGEFNFIHWTPPAAENEVFVRELQKRGIKKLGILRLNQQGIAAVIDDLKNKIKNTDITIVSDQIFNFGERDFKTLILKVKNENPDIIMLMAFSPELEILAKQIKELGVTTPLTSIEMFEFSEQMDLFEGQWYVQAADALESFTSTYRAKFGDDYKPGAPNAYDCFNLIVNAYEKAGTDPSIKPDRLSVINILHNTKNFNGALGVLNVDQDGIIWSKAVVRMIKNGKPVTIGE